MSERKQRRYASIREQLVEQLAKSPDPIARMATIVALLHHKQPRYSWTGFYRKVENGDLLVGPYQGLLACQILPAGVGVCQAAVIGEQTVVVPDVHAFPGHIACDSRSRSEIVVPVRDASGAVVAVLDVDSTQPGSFDAVDAENLERIAGWVYGRAHEDPPCPSTESPRSS
jgi:L-methionine (R)-S-oxide reductase